MNLLKMKSIVITGSTSGIGFGLADALLARGCAVTISGHSQPNLDKAYGILSVNMIRAGFTLTFVTWANMMKLKAYGKRL